MKIRIKKGAMVSQDFSQFQWGDNQTVFSASDTARNGQRKCIADGFGSFIDGEKYGNGAIYVKDCDILRDLEKPHPPSEYVYKSIENFEEIAGYKLSPSHKSIWTMARATMDDLRKIATNSGGEIRESEDGRAG